MKSKIDYVVQSQIEGGRAFGAVIGVIEAGHTEVWSYGTKTGDGSETPNGDTIFETGSLGKTFTGISLAVLAQKNLSLSEKVSKYFSILKGTPAGDLTLLELATHTSGLPSLPDNMPMADPQDPYADYTNDLLVDFLIRWKPEPGKKSYGYSNLGMGLMAQILERANDSSYENLTEQFIFNPLGMNSTVIRPSVLQMKRLAQPHDSFLVPTKIWKDPVLYGAGIHLTTINDLLVFARANLSPSTDILGRAIHDSHTIRVREDDLGMGLAWHELPYGGKRVLFHNGATGGTRTMLALDLKTKRAITFLTNSAAGLRCVVETFFDEPCGLDFVHTPEQLSLFIGNYRAENVPEVSISVRNIGTKVRVLTFEINGRQIRLFGRGERDFVLPGAFQVSFNDLGFEFLAVDGSRIQFARVR